MDRQEHGSEHNSDVLGQLQRLVMMYHLRGNVQEAQEIYELLLDLKDNKQKKSTDSGAA